MVKKYGDDEAGSLAALIAYYGFFSLFPLMLVFVSVLGIVLANDVELQQRIIDSALAQFPIVGPTIANEIDAITGNTLALVIGVATALWAGLGVVQAGQNAMNRVWRVPRKDWPNFWVSHLRSLILLLVLGVMLVVSTLLSGLATVGGADAWVVRLWQCAVSARVQPALLRRRLPCAHQAQPSDARRARGGDRRGDRVDRAPERSAGST